MEPVSSPAVRLNHVTLAVEAVEASAAFYARLGLTQIVASYPDYARFLAPQGDTTLSLHHTEDSPPVPSVSIHFEVDDVDRAVAELKTRVFASSAVRLTNPTFGVRRSCSTPMGTVSSSTTLASTGSTHRGACAEPTPTADRTT